MCKINVIDINKKTLLKLLKRAFVDLYDYDYFTIEKNAHEQCISGRLAMYIRDQIYEDKNTQIRVDIEYNRDGNDIKRVFQSRPHSENDNPNIRPDVLIHERGTGDHNILYCEIKKKSDKNKDENKVNQQVYNGREYKFGLFITRIGTGGIDFGSFENGNSTKKAELYYFDNDKKSIILKGETKKD